MNPPIESHLYAHRFANDNLAFVVVRCGDKHLDPAKVQWQRRPNAPEVMSIFSEYALWTSHICEDVRRRTGKPFEFADFSL
mgnify:FL=1